MLITELKPKDSILPHLGEKAFIVCCEGCREIHFPADEAAELIDELRANGKVIGSIVTDHICNPEHLAACLSGLMDKVDSADTLLVFSCGVGVQTAANKFETKKVITACDSYPLPGVAGLTPLEFDCVHCDRCMLNETGGFCPVTACTKGLRNGQCGGAKNGKCEADRDKECAWERLIN